MPVYFFNLRTDSGSVDDIFGTELPNRDAAIAAARTLARSLEEEREMENGPDCVLAIEICEQEGDVFEVINLEPKACKVLPFEIRRRDFGIASSS